MLSSKKDLYKIREFYDNYKTPNKKRNYTIYCVKYEDIFDKHDELSKLLGIGKLQIVNKSTRTNSNKELETIYSDLIDEMNANKFIEYDKSKNNMSYDIYKKIDEHKFVKKNIAICSCIKNTELYVDDVFKNIKTISYFCNIIKIIISFDISSDNTLMKLCNYKKDYDIDIIINKNRIHKDRGVNITNARNVYMNRLKELNLNIDNFIVMDFDDVCSSKINEKTLYKTFNNLGNNMYKTCGITFSNEKYYDYWALSLDEYIYSIWHCDNSKKMISEMKDRLYTKIHNCKNYITVDSAFNGLVIYDYCTFKDAVYDYNIDLTIFDKDKLNLLVTKGYKLKYSGIDCEHRKFHFNIKQTNNGEIIIMKDSLFQRYNSSHISFLDNNDIKCIIFVCHYTPLQDRKSFFIKQSTKYNLLDKLNFLENYDREQLPSEYLNNYDLSKLKLCEISLFAKHIDGMKSILEGNYEYGIIMEDDCIFEENFLENLTKYITNLPINFDIIYTGVFPFLKYCKKYSGNDHPIKTGMIKINKYFYNMTDICVFPWTGNNKGTDFYIISKNGCKLILDEFEKK